jgi:hypothetical protein
MSTLLNSEEGFGQNINRIIIIIENNIYFKPFVKWYWNILSLNKGEMYSQTL